MTAAKTKKSKIKKLTAAKTKRTPKKTSLVKKSDISKLAAFLKRRPTLGRQYVVFALGLLFATTFIWALIGAKLHQANSDQLVNSYLFENWKTFSGATLPAAHSFLIKWPLFILIKLLGPSAFAFGLITISTALATVGGLAFIIHRIESRKFVFGTIILALASVLLLVPPQPYAGALLPVNMAMIATRNLEYLAYIASLFLLIKSPKFKSYGFWMATTVLGLLAASDKLFLVISLGGALAATAIYTLRNRWRMARLSAKWLSLGLISLIGATLFAWLANHAGLIHLAGQFDSGPYGLVKDIKQLILGSTYGLLGVLTNFGANPAFDATELRHIPPVALSRLTSVSGASFVINAGIFAIASYLSMRLLFTSLRGQSKQALDRPTKLSLLLIWSSLAAYGFFVASNHYYAVDARYLTILMFAGFIAATTYIRRFELDPRQLLRLGGLMTIGILIGMFSVLRTYGASVQALADINDRNLLVGQAINNHPVEALVGDYWRVIPAKLASDSSLQVVPLQACTQDRTVLSSSHWHIDLTQHSFAYLLSLDKSLTDYPDCTLDQIIKQYGKPNQSTLIEGTLDHPKEFVLFYDHGARRSSPVVHPNEPGTSSVLPIALNQLPNTTCPSSTTEMNIVAHQDDDLLFMNPDMLNQLRAEHCERTIYVTAGDAGSSQQYWQARERGSETAYSVMMGSDNIWVHRTVKLADHEFITVSNPRGNSKVSLIFMRLADGNLNGQGFKALNYQSLEHLERGSSKQINSSDGQSSYSNDQLMDAIAALMKIYQPSLVRTQATFNYGHLYPDHSDHKVVGDYVTRAYTAYTKNRPPNPKDKLLYFVGYPVRELPANVGDQDLTNKTLAFLAYAKFDGGVCQSIEQCKLVQTYGSYLRRQYTVP